MLYHSIFQRLLSYLKYISVFKIVQVQNSLYEMFFLEKLLKILENCT